MHLTKTITAITALAVITACTGTSTSTPAPAAATGTATPDTTTRAYRAGRADALTMISANTPEEKHNAILRANARRNLIDTRLGPDSARHYTDGWLNTISQSTDTIARAIL